MGSVAVSPVGKNLQTQRSHSAIHGNVVCSLYVVVRRKYLTLSLVRHGKEAEDLQRVFGTYT